ncbi:MAG: thioredoxin domain-containing protein [Candidatus Saccharimonadales bacterium]
MNRFWVVLTIVVVGLIAAFVFTGKEKNQQSTFSGDATKIQKEDHVIKAPNEKVVLIEYGDYQCPACGAAYAPIKAAVEQLKDQVTFVFQKPAAHFTSLKRFCSRPCS